MNINEMAMALKSDLHLGSKGIAVCGPDFQCCGLRPYEY